MLNIFNRKELMITFSMKKQSQVRDVLEQNHIRYYLKVVNRNSASFFGDSRLRTGTLGQDIEHLYEYIFYVRKKDFSQAKYVIHSFFE